MALLPVEVGDVANGVRQFKPIAEQPIDGESLLIMFASDIQLIEVMLDLAEGRECSRKFKLHASELSETDGFEQVRDGVGGAVVLACLSGAGEDPIDRVRHGEKKVSQEGRGGERGIAGGEGAEGFGWEAGGNGEIALESAPASW